MWLLLFGLPWAPTMTGALCYGELASRFPRAGGGYVYLQRLLAGGSRSYMAGCPAGDGPGLNAS